MPSPRHPSRRGLFTIVSSGAAALLASLCGGPGAEATPAASEDLVEVVVTAYDLRGNRVRSEVRRQRRPRPTVECDAWGRTTLVRD